MTTAEQDNVGERDELLIVPRGELGLPPPKWLHTLRTPVPYVVATYTRRTHCYDFTRCIRELQFLYEKQTRYGDRPDIAYNFLIGGDATVYEGRGWLTQPTLPKRHSQLEPKSIVIAMMGHFKYKGPTFEMMESQRKLIKFGMDNGFIQHKISHFTT